MHELIHNTRNLAEKDCIFCRIAKGDAPCIKIYEDARILAFADINPVSDGHTLLIPKTHYENLRPVPDEELIPDRIRTGPDKRSSGVGRRRHSTSQEVSV